MTIKIIENETGDVLTPEDTRAMRLPFKFGWSSWGVFDEFGRLLETFSSYRQALAYEKLGMRSQNLLAA